MPNKPRSGVRTEFVPGVYREENMRTYQCPHCDRLIYSQNQTDPDPVDVVCHAPFGGHTLIWEE